MALDEGDWQEIDKKLNGIVKAVTEKVSAKVGADMAKALEETVGAKLAEAAKAQTEAAAKPNPEAEERKTLTMRVKELEAERDAARESAKQERTNTTFRKAWQGAKFAGDLADEHLAYLDKSKRLIVEENGSVRVRDPKRAPEETQPTLDEYIAELAKSDRGKLYTPPAPTKGGGLFPRTESNGAGRQHSPAALDAVFGGETQE